jgi:hypothetical protein
MPICATTVVLLIQDSLALAFGLAARVAAVRFGVRLTETIDGIYIFTAKRRDKVLISGVVATVLLRNGQ